MLVGSRLPTRVPALASSRSCAKSLCFENVAASIIRFPYKQIFAAFAEGMDYTTAGQIYGVGLG
jgi:hypothetical protein